MFEDLFRVEGVTLAVLVGILCRSLLTEQACLSVFFPRVDRGCSRSSWDSDGGISVESFFRVFRHTEWSCRGFPFQLADQGYKRSPCFFTDWGCNQSLSCVDQGCFNRSVRCTGSTDYVGLHSTRKACKVVALPAFSSTGQGPKRNY